MTPHISVSLLGTQSDERLASLAGSGHERAFEAIVERYSKALTRYAQRFLGEARAEEVVQAAFLSAWSALTTGTEVRDLRPWLYRIVHNGALNAMNRSESGDLELIEATDAALSPHAILEQNEEVRSALNVIAELPERQRAALLAVAVDGRAHADVATDLGVSDAGVRQLVRRARVQLRSAATALTPLPLALWLADAQRAPSPDVSQRIAEILADGGGNALAASAMKAGAVVVSVAAVATAAPKVSDVVKQDSKPDRAAVISVTGAGAGSSGAGGGPTGLATGFGLGTGGPRPADAPPRQGGLGPDGDAQDGFGGLPGAPQAEDRALTNGGPRFRGRGYEQDMSPLFTPLPGTRQPGRGGGSGPGDNAGPG
ncbi:MAG: sigma-70 family RNA polymerase sigma factor, partial [Solirubrobacteraceae bacterium]|nr:sigma-70 family RNA polymerase sigma factor [Solirubrobacteraceae bacterium]